jgi:hypothetical protein
MKAKYAVGLTLFLAAATWLASAQAGLKGTYLLSVDTAGRTMSGSIGSIRNATTNSNSFLAISFSQVAGVSNFPDDFPEAVTIFFRTPGGSVKYVSVEDPALVTIAHTITTDSYVEMEWDANFVCQQLSVEQSSPLAPKVL